MENHRSATPEQLLKIFLLQEREMEQLEVHEEGPFIPHDVAVMVIRHDMPLVKAWRIYKGLTVDEVAEASGLKSQNVIQLEAADNQLSYSLEKVCLGLKLDIEQITDF